MHDRGIKYFCSLSEKVRVDCLQRLSGTDLDEDMQKKIEHFLTRKKWGPNIDSKGRNWIRWHAALEGFRAGYGTGPTMIKIPLDIIDDLRFDHSDDMFEKAATRVKIMGNDAGFIAEDDQGRGYKYAYEVSSLVVSDISARFWFEIKFQE